MGRRCASFTKERDGKSAHEKLIFLILVARETQSKNTPRYHFTPMEMTKIRRTDHTQCWQGCWAMGPFLHCYWECKMLQPLWKTAWQFLKKLNIHPPYVPAIVPSDIVLRRVKEAHEWMFTRTCLWQPKLQTIQTSINRWIKTMWHMCTILSVPEKKGASYWNTQQYEIVSKQSYWVESKGEVDILHNPVLVTLH